MFTKILIANRGEIACRIIRTAHRLGISCVAVYSEADQNALHVKLADEAYCIGPAASKESYLRGDKIIAVALKSQAQAIHPGYGFLSENAEFAEQCAKAGICFIGPTPTAIRAMGSKSNAKQIMEKAGVPLVPGYHGADQDSQLLAQAAEKIGFPVLLKAAAGGGGKGMRVVWQPKDFAAALAGAKREAKASFGDDQILIEKYLTNPRHVEIQVFADKQGNTIYLFERDCSIQRRHQKIVEEAPAPGLSAKQREKMGAAAVAAAKAIGYVGAGTVEFLFDTDGSFYFMEMNTRLQVEHPVTEFITQQDLVEWQLLVAQGADLPLKQNELKIHGHAFEVRIYAEDPNNDFLPSIGKIEYLATPLENAHVRIDTGFVCGDTISPYYDPMITKLITWGSDRTTALQYLKQALAHYQIVGVNINLNLLSAIAHHPAFAAAELSTAFIEQHQSELIFKPEITNEILALAALFVFEQQKVQTAFQAKNSFDPYSPWQTTDSWRINLPQQQNISFYLQEEIIDIPIQLDKNTIQVAFRGMEFLIHELVLVNNQLTVIMNQQRYIANIYQSDNEIYLLVDDLRYHLKVLAHDFSSHADQEVQGQLTAPMPGKVVALIAELNKPVEPGSALVIVEAMKMEHTLFAPRAGVVKEWYFKVGDIVDEGVELLKFEEI